MKNFWTWFSSEISGIFKYSQIKKKKNDGKHDGIDASRCIFLILSNSRSKTAFSIFFKAFFEPFN